MRIFHFFPASCSSHCRRQDGSSATRSTFHWWREVTNLMEHLKCRVYHLICRAGLTVPSIYERDVFLNRSTSGTEKRYSVTQLLALLILKLFWEILSKRGVSGYVGHTHIHTALTPSFHPALSPSVLPCPPLLCFSIIHR